MTEWVDVAALAQLRRRKRLRVEVGAEDVALFLVGERVYAFRDICVHKERSLSKGTVLHGRVICPGHQWAFDLETGRTEDREECQPTYPVRVEGERVYVGARPRLPQLDSPNGGSL